MFVWTVPLVTDYYVCPNYKLCWSSLFLSLLQSLKLFNDHNSIQLTPTGFLMKVSCGLCEVRTEFLCAMQTDFIPQPCHRSGCSVETTNKMQTCNRIYYSKIYWRLSMFRVACRSSSGAPNCICSLWFIYPCGDRSLSRLGWNWVLTQPGQRPVTTWVYKPEAANTVWSSWWWAVCRSKHVEPSINFGIINSITRLHLVGFFYWFILRCMNPWILKSSGCCFVVFHRKGPGVDPSLFPYKICGGKSGTATGFFKITSGFPYQYYKGRDSSVGIATRYGLEAPGIESRWDEIFRTRPDRFWVPPSLLYNGYRVFFLGVKRPGRGVDRPSPSSAKVKERVELYLYSSSGSSWPVLWWTSYLYIPRWIAHFLDASFLAARFWRYFVSHAYL